MDEVDEQRFLRYGTEDVRQPCDALAGARDEGEQDQARPDAQRDLIGHRIPGPVTDNPGRQRPDHEGQRHQSKPGAKSATFAYQSRRAVPQRRYHCPSAAPTSTYPVQGNNGNCEPTAGDR